MAKVLVIILFVHFRLPFVSSVNIEFKQMVFFFCVKCKENETKQIKVIKNDNNNNKKENK